MFKKHLPSFFLSLLILLISSCSNPLDNYHVTREPIRVVFSVNGGNAIPDMEIPVGTKYKDVDLPDAVRSGYEFAGWFSNNNSYTPIYKDSVYNGYDYYSFLESPSSYGSYDNDFHGYIISLFTKWKSDNPSIVFDANGGYFQLDDDTKLEKITKTYKELLATYGNYNGVENYIENYVNTVLRIAAVKEHSSLAGWNGSKCYGTSSSGFYAYNTISDLEQGYDYTISAYWEPANKLTFETNGGTPIAEYEFGNELFMDDTVYALDDFLTTKDGYVFAGWYTDSELTNLKTGRVMTSITLYAKWVAKDYEVTKENLKTKLDLISKDMHYINELFYHPMEGYSDKKTDADAFNISYSGSLTDNELKLINEALNYDNHYIYANVDLTKATGMTDLSDSAFFNCSGLRGIKTSEKFSSIGNRAFGNCKFLKKVTLAATTTTVSDYAFSGCTALESITIPNGVENLGSGIFSECANLKTVNLPVSIESIGEEAFAKCVELEEIQLPAYLLKISSSMFKECSKLTKITFPDSPIYIYDSVFENCTSLKTITIPESVVSIGSSAFKGCSELTSFVIPSKVREIEDSTFEDCEKLTTITIPSEVTSIGNKAFLNCAVLGNVTLPSNLESIGSEAFKECKSITKFELPDSLLSFGRSVFINCTGLTEINIPDEVEEITYHLFDGCTALKTVTIGDNSKITKITERAFQNCTSLNNIKLSEKLETIDKGAFYKCSSLTNITIPSTVCEIKDSVFYGCSKLASLVFEDSTGWYKSTSTSKNGDLVEFPSDASEVAKMFRGVDYDKFWYKQ